MSSVHIRARLASKFWKVREMRCSSCGAEISDGLLFCPSCGALAKSEKSNVIESEVQPVVDVAREEVPEMANYETLQPAGELEDVFEAQSASECTGSSDRSGDDDQSMIESAESVETQGSSFEIVETENPKSVSRNASGPFVVPPKLFIGLAVVLAAAFIVLGIVLFLPDKLSQETDRQTSTQSVIEDREKQITESAGESSEAQPQAIERSETSERSASEAQHEAVQNQDEPFWGIWVMASKDRMAAEDVANELAAKGYDAAVMVTTDWSNLNSEPWYVVTAGRYKTADEANGAIPGLVDNGYTDAYAKYTGDYIG